MSASGIESVRDYHALAKERLEPDIWRYLQDDDNAGNERALSEICLMPRPLSDVRGGHTRLKLFGQELDHPILLAPVAYQRLFHSDGETASTMAAAAQGGQAVISSLASQPFDAISRATTEGGRGGPWFQLYWQGERERTRCLLRRALAAGCTAVVFTVDAPVKRATLQLPPHVAAVNLEASTPPTTQASMVFDGWMTQAPTWDDLAWLRRQTELPLLVKGVLHPDDAQRALALGCDGIIVSNHGGRILAGAPASLGALSRIVQRIDGRIPVMFDSGIRNGRDVFVALAHGATAVLVGRPYIWGLAANGAMGVAQVLRLLRDELEMTMALCGCASLKAIGQNCLCNNDG
ncbi:MAG TPA: alpha-hydroxy acid oxidase [Burkholderiaceae bacterium]|jgi:4-hydroxymandelate oxidase|nr:alpha-hydroxy acid oxidase [Burkholderiaceae bacterium]